METSEQPKAITSVVPLVRHLDPQGTPPPSPLDKSPTTNRAFVSTDGTLSAKSVVMLSSPGDVLAAMPRPTLLPEDERLLPEFVASPRGVLPVKETSSILPEQITFTGEANFEGDVRIAGKLLGIVCTKDKHTISVEEGGSVKGTLRATHLSIHGTTEGEHFAEGGLANFSSTAVSKGTITYSRLRISEGADVEASMRKIAA